MKRMVVREHTRIIPWSGEGAAPDGDARVHLERRLYDRLKRFDQVQREDADRVFDILMGEDVSSRKSFIQSNAKLANLDI